MISASFAISKPCGVEVKLQVKIVITNPLPLVILLRALNCLVPCTMENSPTEFSVESPTWTNTSGFENLVEVRTDAKSESGLVDGFPSMNISSGRHPYTVFTSQFLEPHVLLAGYYPVLTDACIQVC